MPIPRVLALVGLAAVSFSCDTPQASFVGSSVDACDKTVLPAPIGTLLRAKFPSWRPKQLLDMDGDDQQVWPNGPNGKECPGIAIGHFESAESLSYAFLLVQQSSPSGGHKIVVFSEDATKGAYTWRLLDPAEGRRTPGLSFRKQRLGNTTTWRVKNLSTLN